MSDTSPPSDPFKEARQKEGVLVCPFQGEALPMILRHADVRKAARDHERFSSDAPFRVPIPSEEDVRSMRQLPIETDPPVHGDYREIVDPFFQRAKSPEMAAQVKELISEYIKGAIEREATEIVRDFALPIQSHALTYLLNVPETEAATWISWGVHVFRDGDSKGNALEDYLTAQFDLAKENPGTDFFSALIQAQFRGRSLTRSEMMGYANLAFAGGRDTIIHSISNVINYLGHHPDALAFLKANPKNIIHASEEVFRAFMPLTHIGRVCPEKTDVHGVSVPAQGRVSLCWSSANFDETVFDSPHEVQLDRKPNPHVSFGFGAHLCLGAPHARLIIRTLLQLLSERISKITILESTPHVEREAAYERTNGFDRLLASLTPVKS